MKTALLSGLALVATAHLASAQILASDDFSYVGPLTSNGWVAHSGAGNKVVLSDGLVATLDQSGGSGEDVNLAFPPQTATDTTYASFTLNVPSGNPVNPDAQGLYFAHFKNSATYYHARVGLLTPNTTGDYALAISDSSDLGAGTSWLSDLSFDTNYQVVISWDAATADCTLWLDPVDMLSPSIVTTGAFTGDLMEGFALRQSSDYTGFITVDNVIVGKTFADVNSGGPSGPGTPYCPGDGTGTACPCGNNNNGSMGGCDWGNPAFPEGGVLSGSGSNSIGAADTYLHATGVENNFGIFFEASIQVNGGMGNVLNDGLRCAGNGLVRLTPPTSATGNAASTPAPIQLLGSTAVAGTPKRYQYWFRTPAGPCGTSANLTNGYEILWAL